MKLLFTYRNSNYLSTNPSPTKASILPAIFYKCFARETLEALETSVTAFRDCLSPYVHLDASNPKSFAADRDIGRKPCLFHIPWRIDVSQISHDGRRHKFSHPL